MSISEEYIRAEIVKTEAEIKKLDAEIKTVKIKIETTTNDDVLRNYNIETFKGLMKRVNILTETTNLWIAKLPSVSYHG